MPKGFSILYRVVVGGRNEPAIRSNLGVATTRIEHDNHKDWRVKVSTPPSKYRMLSLPNNYSWLATRPMVDDSQSQQSIRRKDVDSIVVEEWSSALEPVPVSTLLV